MSFNIKHGLIDEPTDLGLRLDAQVCVFFVALRALPAPLLTHSIAYPWLLGGNGNLKQHLSCIKVL